RYVHHRLQARYPGGGTFQRTVLIARRLERVRRDLGQSWKSGTGERVHLERQLIDALGEAFDLALRGCGTAFYLPAPVFRGPEVSGGKNVCTRHEEPP